MDTRYVTDENRISLPETGAHTCFPVSEIMLRRASAWQTWRRGPVQWLKLEDINMFIPAVQLDFLMNRCFLLLGLHRQNNGYCIIFLSNLDRITAYWIMFKPSHYPSAVIIWHITTKQTNHTALCLCWFWEEALYHTLCNVRDKDKPLYCGSVQRQNYKIL